MTWYPPAQDERDKALRPTRTKGAKAKTRRWCKGKEGREHQPVFVIAKQWSRECKAGATWRGEPRWFCSHHWECSTCGKHLEHEKRRPDCPHRDPGNTLPIRYWFMTP